MCHVHGHQSNQVTYQKAIDWSEANLQPLQLRLFESERQNQICNPLAQGLKIEEEEES